MISDPFKHPYHHHGGTKRSSNRRAKKPEGSSESLFPYPWAAIDGEEMQEANESLGLWAQDSLVDKSRRGNVALPFAKFGRFC